MICQQRGLNRLLGIAMRSGTEFPIGHAPLAHLISSFISPRTFRLEPLLHSRDLEIC